MSQASGSDSLDTEGTLTIVCERVTYVEHQLRDLQIQLRKARVSFSSLPAAGRARRALIIIMSDSHAFTSPVPLPTFSLSGAGEVSSEGGAVPEGCADQFPFSTRASWTEFSSGGLSPRCRVLLCSLRRWSRKAQGPGTC